MAKIRTFVAIDVSGAVSGLVKKTVGQIAIWAGDYRWVEPESLHLTLNFLGDVAEREVPEICRSVKKAVEGIGEFAIEVGGLQAFPGPDRPRTLWLGLQSGVDELVRLQSALAKRLDDDLGFPPERKDFCPHLTLGRINRNGRWSQDIVEHLQTPREPETATSFVDEVVVYSSHRDRGGPTYTPMATVELE